MSHLDNAGYRILSFKYSPVVAKKKKNESGLEEENAYTNSESTRPADRELPSLSSLMASLGEIDDPPAMASEPEDHAALETPAAPIATAPPPLTEFHLFGDLPTELRLKIWNLSFLPRVVELRTTRPNYANSRYEGQPQWQSGCSNPAALSVCAEARALALAHFRIAYPLAAAAGRRGREGRPLRRTLYVAPARDTVCLLGHDSDFARLSGALGSLRAADPRGEGVRRLGLSVRGWGYGGSAMMMRGLGRTVLRDLEQLVLFMYGELRPPPGWGERGAAAGEGDALERFRREGNGLELVPCEGGSAWYAYKIWSGGKGRQYWDDDGNIMRVGQNEIKIMDLEFRTGW